MTTKMIFINIAISIIAGVVIVITQKFFTTMSQNSKIVRFLKTYKIILILLHSIISYLIWQVSGTFSIEIKLALIFVINILILLTRIKESQIGNAICLKSKKVGTEFLEFEVHKLKQLNPNEKLKLTWETLGKGLENLRITINNASGVAPNIIFGINEVGIIAATYLSSYMKGNPHLGIIRTGAKLSKLSREIIQFNCPEDKVIQFKPSDYKGDVYPTIEYSTIKNPKSIAIVDSEIKSGNAIKDIIKLLCEIYGKDIDIIYIALCGVIKKGDEKKKIDDINYFGWEIEETKYKPDFIAFYINPPGIRGPEGI